MPSRWYFSSQNSAEESRKLRHLVPAVVEDAALPVGVEALLRVGMIEQVRAVEVRQAVAVVGEVRRHPVQDDADAALVQHVHEVHEVLRRAEAAGRREVAQRLVAPRSRERMLGDRHQLDVREAHPLAVVGQGDGGLAVGQGPVELLGHGAPGAEMHFVDGDRRREVVALPAIAHPGLVAPLVAEIVDVGAEARRDLVVHAERVGPVGRIAPVADVVLVARPRPDAWDEQLPHARVALRMQAVRSLVPAVEVAEHRDVVGAGCPHGEVDAFHAVLGSQLRAELVVEAQVAALVEQVEVLRPEDASSLDHGSCGHVVL